MKHFTIELSDWSERRIAQYHHQRKERINRALFPVYLATLVAVVLWAFQILPL